MEVLHDLIEPFRGKVVLAKRMIQNSKRSLLSNSKWNLIGFLSSLLILILSTPAYIKLLGIERFGIWALINAILGSYSILNIGVNQSTVKYLAGSIRSGDTVASRKLLGSALAQNLHLGLVALVISIFASEVIVNSVTNFDSIMRSDAQRAIIISTIFWIFNQQNLSYRTVAEAAQDYRAVVVGNIFTQVSLVTLGLLALTISPSVSSVMTAQAIASFGLIFYWRRVCMHFIQDVRFSLKLDMEIVRKTLDFNLWLNLNAIVGTAASTADRFLIGIFLSPDILGIYSIGGRIQGVLRGIFYNIGTVLFPATSEVASEPGRSENLIVNAGRNISALSALIFIVVMLSGPDFLRIWLGHDIAVLATPLMQVFVAVLFLELPSYLLSQYLYGHANAKWMAKINIVTSTLTLILMIKMLDDYGAIGLAWAGFIGLLITRVPFHLWLYFKCFAGYVTIQNYMHAFYGVLLSALAAGAIVYPLRLYLHQTSSLLFTTIVSFTVVPMLVIGIFFLIEKAVFRRSDIYITLVNLLRRHRMLIGESAT